MVKVQRLFAKTNLKIQVYRTESKELEGALFPFLIIVSLWYNRDIKIVKERIEGGANEKAVLRLFINCPFVCINFDFFWLNKARQLYMDF